MPRIKLTIADHPLTVEFPCLNLTVNGVPFALEDGGSAAQDAAASAPSATESSRPGRWLSPMEEAILRVLTTEWQSSETIAAKAKMLDVRDLSVILRNLVARDFLESKPGRGFRLRAAVTMPPSAETTPSIRLLPEEVAILSVATRDWLTAEKLADKANLIDLRDVGFTLRSMVRRGLLESLTGRGYRLPAGSAGVPAPTEPTADADNRDAEDEDAEDAEDMPTGLIPLILSTLQDRGASRSLGELCGAMPQFSKSDVKVALQRLVQSGDVVRDGRCYRSPEQQE